MIEHREINGYRYILMQPNRSASWKQTRCFILIAGGMALLIGFVWASLGIWMILPFAGVEVLLLSFLMYKVSCSTYRKQVISIDDHYINIEVGTTFPKQSWAMQKTNTFYLVSEQGVIQISDATQTVVVGQFLNTDDKKILTQQLKQIGIYERSMDNYKKSSIHA